MKESHEGFMHKLDKSAVLTVIGILLLFSSAVGVTLIAPSYVDPSWTEVASPYQRQMYEVADPNLYVSTAATGGDELQLAYHIKDGYTLLAFAESETVRIIAPPELEKYVTRHGESRLKLSSKLMLLREANAEGDRGRQATALQEKLQSQWRSSHSQSAAKELRMPRFDILELYEPEAKEAFALAETDGILENWVDSEFVILDEEVKQRYHEDPGVLYVSNPKEYRIAPFRFGKSSGFQYDPNGRSIASLDELKSPELGFMSREELIQLGEDIYRIEGCWYCHTDQTRTLVQDTILNGSETNAAPPSSANEYVYQRVTFPGTRRIGPDISRVGIKRPNRDWHKSHFWSPKTASAGTIMPSFRHFFDDDPRGTSKSPVGIPNYKFEAIFQYLMTKGTRITAPTQAWWQGRDPLQTTKIIEGQKKV